MKQVIHRMTATVRFGLAEVSKIVKVTETRSSLELMSESWEGDRADRVQVWDESSGKKGSDACSVKE